MQKLLMRRREELDDMHANQSDEMNKATASDQSNISQLVEKHMGELDEFENKYKAQANNLRKNQRKAFLEYINKFYEEQTEATEPDEEEPQSERTWRRRWFKLRDQPMFEFISFRIYSFLNH